MNEETMQKIEEYQAEIRCLKSDLAWSDDIGDYKLMKIQEARLMGNDDPYDLEEYVANRNTARARINELQELIAELEATTTTE